MWLVFKICSSIFQVGMCSQHASQSSWNFWNSCMLLQKNAVVVFLNASTWWIMCFSRSCLAWLYGMEFSTRLAMTIGPSFLFCWGIFTSPVCHSELGRRTVSQQGTSGICSSFQQIPVCCCRLHPPALFHPWGWGSGRAMPPGTAQPPAKWQVAGDPSGCLHFIFPSPHPPFARYYKMVNLAVLILRRILFSNTTGIGNGHGLTPEMTWLN